VRIKADRPAWEEPSPAGALPHSHRQLWGGAARYLFGCACPVKW